MPTTAPINYTNDGFSANTDLGTGALYYTVSYPATGGPYPVVFGMEGSTFNGNAGINTLWPSTFDPECVAWSAFGFVVVNIEYHGVPNGLTGDVTYPGTSWGSVADGIAELDLKVAIRFFYANNPAQYNANPTKPFLLFGESSGGHTMQTAGLTGISGAVPHVGGVCVWSSLNYAIEEKAGTQGILDTYMNTTAGTDKENFGDSFHRLSAIGQPPQYAAVCVNETFMTSTALTDYINQARLDGLLPSWRRVLNGTTHATLGDLTFTGTGSEVTDPPALIGDTVRADSVKFANAVLADKPIAILASVGHPGPRAF